MVWAFALALTALVGGGTSEAASCPLSSACYPWPPSALNVSAGGSAFPRKLPANEYAPVTWSPFLKITTSDGTHPPALRELVVDIDKNVRLNATGFPTCRGTALEERSSKGALEACRAAFLGEGKAHVEIAGAEGAPELLATRLLVFNGGQRNGAEKLLIHAYLGEPGPTAVVTRIVAQKKGGGFHATAEVPVIADGLGSLVDLTFELGKTYSYKGKKVGYFEARCPAGVFKVNMPKLVFKNEAHTPGQSATTALKGSVVVPCTPQS